MRFGFRGLAFGILPCAGRGSSHVPPSRARCAAMGSRRLLLAAILLCCVVGRGVWALHLAHTDRIVTDRGDTPSYLGPARELAQHGRFTDPGPPPKPEFLRTPGYPAFVAAVYRVFGIGDNTAVLLVQI